jgi:hypothetical protein
VQVLQAALPSAEVLSAAQSEHLVSTVLSVVAALNLPAPQSEQSVEAGTSEYLPAAQSEQSVTAVAPEVPRYLPAKHAWTGYRTNVQQRGQITAAC